MPPPTDVGRELERLRTLLLHLPLKASTATYPFENFVPDQEWIENTGSLQGSVNHSLEVAFGSRAAAANAPIKLTSHGPDLLAVVDVLALAITGHDGENPILIKWIGDLTRAAEAVTVGEADAEAASLGKREREIGLDEVIERPELGSRHAFEVTERDGINLGALALLDLLSDEPVDGATEPPTGHMVRGGKTNKNSSDNGKLSVAQFEF